MKLPRILRKVYDEPWLITPPVHRSIQRALEAHLEGINPSLDGLLEDETMGEYQLDGVSVIPIHGIIGKHLSGLEMACGGCSLDSVDAMIDEAAQDPSVRAVLLDVNSPGGTVTGVPETAAKIAKLAEQKPVIAFTDSEMCSAAYWLASQANAIYATQSATVGSVGVYLALLDESRALENAGIKVNAISSGKFKLAGAPFKPLTDDERAMFQAGVTKLHDQFKAAILSKRNIQAGNLEGQCFDGEEAIDANLVDGITSFEEAMMLTAALTKPKD